MNLVSESFDLATDKIPSQGLAQSATQEDGRLEFGVSTTDTDLFKI